MNPNKTFIMMIFLSLFSMTLSACNTNQQQQTSLQEISSTVEPTEISEEEIVFEDALEPYTFHQFKETILNTKIKNSDAIGWIYVRNTLINYPVYQYSDNAFYLERNEKKVKDINGSIFADYRCRFPDLSQNTVIYGHNMLSEKMFGSQKRYAVREFLETNPILEFSTTEKDRQWKIFAVFFIEPTFNYIEPNPSKELFLNIIQTAKEKSLFKINNVEVKDDDKILTLSTCAPRSMGDIRFVVMARLLRDGEGHRLSFD